MSNDPLDAETARADAAEKRVEELSGRVVAYAIQILALKAEIEDLKGGVNR